MYEFWPRDCPTCGSPTCSGRKNSCPAYYDETEKDFHEEGFNNDVEVAARAAEWAKDVRSEK